MPNKKSLLRTLFLEGDLTPAEEEIKRRATPRFSMFDLGDQPRETPPETRAALNALFQGEYESPDARIQALGQGIEAKSRQLSEEQKPELTAGEYAALKKFETSGAISPKTRFQEEQKNMRALQMAQAMSGRQEKEHGFKEGMFQKELGSVGQKEIDKEVAKDYSDFVLAGGYADTKKQVDQLRDTLQNLKKTDYATGPILGFVPRKLRDVITPGGASLQDEVEDVVQRNLRKILGAQFTENEGERLIARAYNPRQEEPENLKRVNRLLDQIEEAAKSKAEAGAYLEKNGTLKGFTGKLYRSANDFLSESNQNPSKTTDKTKKDSGEASMSSSEYKEAFKWAVANPKDPRAAEILKRIVK